MPLALAIGWVLLAGVGELDCRERSTCPEATPVRVGGVCVAPFDAGPRDAGNDAAMVDAGRCGSCSIDLPVCDEVALRCICDDTNGCLSPTASHCIDGGCYQCETDEDCDDPMTPRCDGGSCVTGCTDAVCGDRFASSAPNCDERAGTCVACSAANEDSLCDPMSCNRATGACTSTIRGSVGVCEACVADSECDDTDGDASCVVDDFDGAEIGSFCFLHRPSDMRCGDTNEALRPYSSPEEHRSIDDPSMSIFCMLTTTTCPGYVGFRTAATPCAANTQCGVPDIDDALCDPARMRCSYSCARDSDCPPTATCGGVPSRCR